MRHSDSGQVYGKLIFALALVVALAYVGIKAIPVYVNNYQLADHIRDLAVEAAVNRSAPELVQGQVVAYARSLDLPVTADNVRVTVREGGVKIEIDYTVPVDLKLYTWTLHFAPSAEGRAL